MPWPAEACSASVFLKYHWSLVRAGITRLLMATSLGATSAAAALLRTCLRGEVAAPRRLQCARRGKGVGLGDVKPRWYAQRAANEFVCGWRAHRLHSTCHDELADKATTRMWMNAPPRNQPDLMTRRAMTLHLHRRGRENGVAHLLDAHLHALCRVVGAIKRGIQQLHVALTVLRRSDVIGMHQARMYKHSSCVKTSNKN